MKRPVQLLALLLACALHLPGRTMASSAIRQSDPRQEQANLKELRFKARERFEGRDEWTASPLSHDEHFERLVILSDDAIQTIKDYPGLDLSVPSFAQKQKPGFLGDHYDYIILFGKEAPPSGQPNNYYANLTRNADPEDSRRRSYQERLRDFIMRDPRERLEPADVIKHALDAAHGNYRLAMLTAHNFLKEVAYVGREEIDIINQIEKPADRSRWPAEWVGISPWLGDIARKLRGLRDSRVADKLGPWYHFFVPLAAEAWGSPEAAERMTAVEHAGRKSGIFKNPDPEKREIDLIAVHVMKEILKVRTRPLESQTGGPQPPPSGQPAGPTGRLRVEVSDPLFPDSTLNYVTMRASTGSEPQRVMITFESGRVVELRPGKYVVTVDQWADFASDLQEVAVEAGRTAFLRFILQRSYGFIDVTVTDIKTGQSLEGVDVATSGPISLGPLASPASFYADPGSYRVIIPKSVVKGKHYLGKEATVEVTAGKRSAVSIALDPYPPEPKPTTIRIQPNALELQPGEGIEISAEVCDQEGNVISRAQVTWSSSAPSVAQVDAAGQVSGVSKGKARITAACGDARAAIIAYVTSSTLLQSCRIINKPKSLPCLAAYVLKGEAIDTEGKRIDSGIRFSWKSFNTEIAAVDEETGRVSTKKPGTFTISLEAIPEDGPGASVLEEIVVEKSWMDPLIFGRVFRADNTPAGGAVVQVAGGPVVMSNGQGEFTTLVGGGPYPEGSVVEVEAYLGGESGRASGIIHDGASRNITVVLNKPGARPDQPLSSSMTPERRQAILDQINAWQKALDCLLEGKKKYPDSWVDCNGNWLLRDRDVEIAHFQELIRDARIKLGLPVSSGAEGTSQTTPGLRATSASSRQAAVDFLSFLYFYGPSIWYTPPDGSEARLEHGASAPPGSALRTGKDSRLAVLINQTTTVTVGEDTQVRLPKPESEGGRKSLCVQSGRVDFSRPEGPPSFDDLIIATPHGSMTPVGTIYRVEVDEAETRLSVFEGVVHTSGTYIIKDYGPGESGKPSPQKELEVRAGERARLIGLAASEGTQGQVPQWARGEVQRVEQEQASSARDKPAGQASSALPSWAKPPSRKPDDTPVSRNPSSGATGPLDIPDPWNHPTVQQLMDQWVRTAVPPSTTPGVVMRYNDWAQPLSQAARATSDPEHPADWTRYRYLWENRWRYDSVNLCTLGVFMEKSIKGESLEDCKKGTVESLRPMWPGALAALAEVAESDWINGKPELGGREVLLLVFPGPVSDAGLPQQLYFCLQKAHNRAERIKASRKVFIVLASAESQRGRDAADVWKTIMDGFRFAFPVAVDRSGAALRALQEEGFSGSSASSSIAGIVFDQNGTIIRRGACEALLSGLEEGKKR